MSVPAPSVPPYLLTVLLWPRKCRSNVGSSDSVVIAVCVCAAGLCARSPSRSVAAGRRCRTCGNAINGGCRAAVPAAGLYAPRLFHRI